MTEWIGKIRNRIKKGTGGDRRPLLIVALGLLGMLLLLFSGGGGRTEKKTAPPDLTASQEATERQLTALLKTVAGVGRVKVAVTVDRLQANVYTVNTEQTSEPERAQRSEKDVFTETGSDTGGLVLYTVTPVIRGVAVSCEGGGSATVRQEVTRLVAAALGISANKIWVARMQT